MPETLTPPEQENENQDKEFELPQKTDEEITLNDFIKKLNESREKLKSFDAKEKERKLLDEVNKYHVIIALMEMAAENAGRQYKAFDRAMESGATDARRLGKEWAQASRLLTELNEIRAVDHDNLTRIYLENGKFPRAGELKLFDLEQVLTSSTMGSPDKYESLIKLKESGLSDDANLAENFEQINEFLNLGDQKEQTLEDLAFRNARTKLGDIDHGVGSAITRTAAGEISDKGMFGSALELARRLGFVSDQVIEQKELELKGRLAANTKDLQKIVRSGELEDIRLKRFLEAERREIIGSSLQPLEIIERGLGVELDRFEHDNFNSEKGISNKAMLAIKNAVLEKIEQ
ncbi:hypothetical protein KC644_03020 [Candidatus Berkelbacteria bacterium]|nr:hypothetical protein [Candidatus Berkelbacteria bacterium]